MVARRPIGTTRYKLAPSILSADFSKLGSEVREVEKAGADWIHVDVMDGHFAPNLTMGPAVVRSLSKITTLPLDCHLMVTHPEKWLEPFASAGAEIITVHIEVGRTEEWLKRIRELGCKAGLSINPDTPVAALKPFAEQCDLILLMSVFPGFSGQSFISATWERLAALKRLQQDQVRRGVRPFLIEVDGGVSAENSRSLADQGADVLVAGNAVFAEKNRARAIKRLRS